MDLVNKIVKNTKAIDRPFLAILFTIVILGIIALTSASAPIGYSQFSDTYYFVKKQILFGLIPGLISFYFCVRIKFDWWRKLSWIIYLASLVLLVLVFIPGIGIMLNG